MDKTTLYSKAFLENIRGISEPDLSSALLRLKDVLKQKKEEHLYPRILKRIISSIEYQENATVTSARPLDEMLEKEVIEKLKKNFPGISEEGIKFEIDEKMIGGISISYRDNLFDGTVRGALSKLKTKI
jgi:F0F1-type ATP synthase delta subunit